MTEIITSISEEVREARTRIGMTQYTLAAKVGVAIQTINYIEGGKRMPSIELLQKIAEVTGCKLQVRLLLKTNVMFDTTEKLI